MTTPTQDGGDHILLIPSSQSTSPSVAAHSTFQEDQSPTSNNNHAIRSPSTSQVSLSHRGSAAPAALPPQASPAASIRKNQNQHQSHSNASLPTNDDTSRDPGSKFSQFIHRYILTPLQSFQLYLSTPDREAHVSSFPQPLRSLPPWLLPHYHSKRQIFRSTILGPLFRALLLTGILAVLIASTIMYSLREGQPESLDYAQVNDFDWTPINPRGYLKPWNETFGDQWDVLLDGHSHSRYSDGRMGSETLLKWHIANGYNALVVSDHNTVAGGLAAQKIALEKYADKITVIPAMELTCCRLHMNLIGINETIDYAITKWPTDDQLRATIARAHELGGLAIINHIPWSNTTEYGYQLPRMQHHPSREQLVEMGVDGFEVANGGTLDTISLKFIQDNNLILITGTDVHYPDSGAFSWTILNTNGNRTAENIMAQLRARRSSFLFDPTGTQPVAYAPESEKWYETAPPTLLGQYFQMFWNDQTGMYSFSPEGGFCHEEYVTIRWRLIGYFIGWVLVGFLIFEAVRLVVVGCILGPVKRRRRYLRKKKILQEEEDGRVDDDLSDREDRF
ncbi:Polymerase/histidinol phosphatase-like protein [Gamsiella multidivaricata]|uniref:Polymerase/histidinol phosphatase-like protein n=1 Tax=Gamsiella multidivaricata TaxID=101098 RepID=UPI0022203A23|nr:Polymerase/histidinol phosphatase-like protein [Gamsiella multidivaricata]KAG0366119.1 hypothetical protein BGZ54_005797 [Gamsiella multidivaricata]KAI7829378.1 Polymerase/histidinol phosphatase-like protein [Gamsiella multidivaricata]